MTDQIHIINKLQDKFNILGYHKLLLDLPQIAVVGGQSAGKTSVLESFVKKDFLPRGSGIVTRRPLILQLINDKNSTNMYGEFLHMKGNYFYDFDKIRREIINETEREVIKTEGISDKPIALKIFSADVLDLTLIDLPGMVKVPDKDKGQPDDIDERIEKMIWKYISQDTCLILAVTSATQDLATSDALRLAKRADPEGKRTIGVLTKLDLMDKGTDKDARSILIGKYLPLKLGYIGVVNRSQKDIESNKDMETALKDEKMFFAGRPAFSDILDRLGTEFLAKHLKKELSKHIRKALPPLKKNLEIDLNDLIERLGEIQSPLKESDKERILSESNDQFRIRFESDINGTGDIEFKKLSGGAKISKIMTRKFARVLDEIFSDENQLRKKIAFAIENSRGIHLGIFTPDSAFRTCVRNQIEMFRKPSLVCVDFVAEEIIKIIEECIENIESYDAIRELFKKLTLNSIHTSKKICNSYIDHMVEMEKAFLNTINEDFLKIIRRRDDFRLNTEKKFIGVLDNKQKSNWITFKDNIFWFVLEGDLLVWYKDYTLKERKESVSVKGSQMKLFIDDKKIILFLTKKIKIWDSSNQMELIFNSRNHLEEWKVLFEEKGVKPNYSETQSNDSDNYSDNSYNFRYNEELEIPERLKEQVEEVKKLILAYLIIMKKKFKDDVPKICTLDLINKTAKFIAIDLKLRIREEISSINDIVEEDPNEGLRKDLVEKRDHLKEAIHIINSFE